MWGFTCIASDDAAVQRVIALKARDRRKGLILVGACRTQLEPLLAPLEPAWRSRMDAAWPGPTTFVAPAARGLSEWLTGNRRTVAVRVSAHPVLAGLTGQLGAPIVSTSANISGQKPLRSATAIQRAFMDKIDGVVAGELGGRKRPSDIIDVRTGRQLR